MITQIAVMDVAGRYAPCLAGALSGVLPVQASWTAWSSSKRNAGGTLAAAAAAGTTVASSCFQGAVRSISSSKDDADEKLGRPTTPWVRQVISGVDLMRHPKYNKGGCV